MSSKIEKSAQKPLFSQDYLEKRSNFLDNLEPSDFRNGESFNLAASIIDQIIQAYHLKLKTKITPKIS